MTTLDEKWKFGRYSIHSGPQEPDRFLVEFLPPDFKTIPDPAGGNPRTPRSGVVGYVRRGDEFELDRYTAPEITIPGLERADYVAGALVLLQEHLGLVSVDSPGPGPSDVWGG